MYSTVFQNIYRIINYNIIIIIWIYMYIYIYIIRSMNFHIIIYILPYGFISMSEIYLVLWNIFNCNAILFIQKLWLHIYLLNLERRQTIFLEFCFSLCCYHLCLLNKSIKFTTYVSLSLAEISKLSKLSFSWELHSSSLISVCDLL